MCLSSIPAISADKSLYEIVVINNNCTDNTDELCKKFAQENPDILFRQIPEKNQGLGFARNRGITEAKGDIISFIDDDAEVTPHFADSIIQAFKQYPHYNAMGGKVLPIFENKEEPRWMSKYMSGPISKIDFGEVTRNFPKKYPVGCNMIFRRGVFEKYGNFKGELSRSDDKDMFLRLKKHREKVLYVPEIVVYHHIPADRITYKSILNLGYSSGRFEATRIKEQKLWHRISKMVELIFKFAASLFIGCLFFVLLKPEKGRFLIAYMYNMMTGFLRNFSIA